MKKGKVLLLLFCVCFCTISFSITKKAVIIVPVADLTLQKIKTIYPKKTTQEGYKNLALEGIKKSAHSCPRVHQLLFHEQVDVLCQHGDELLIAIPNCFYLSNGTKGNRYWTHKNNLCLISKNLDVPKLPSQISFCGKNMKTANRNTITLLLPFYDKKNKRTFSAGTRFIRAEKKSNGQQILAWSLNKKGTGFDVLQIPRALCFQNSFLTKKEKREFFVELLRKWSASQRKYIPYVWGGCSFTNLYNKAMIYAKHTNNQTAPVFWQRTKHQIASGLDCSGAVLRAAQIFNIPYFCKNSTTATQQLTKIKNAGNLQNGDLFSISGHILIVSDKKNNKLIEARSHYHGYGKLHEKKISEVFDQIETYEQLIAHSNAGKTFFRLDSTGKKADKFNKITFLKLPV